MSNSYRVRIQLKFFSEHCQNTWLHQMYKYTNLHTKYICFGIAVYRVQCTLYMTFYLLHSLQRYFRRKIHNFLFCLNWCMYLKWWNILPGHHAEQWKNTIWFNRFRFSCRKKLKSMAQTIEANWKPQINMSTWATTFFSEGFRQFNRTIPRHIIIWKPYTICKQSQAPNRTFFGQI